MLDIHGKFIFERTNLNKQIEMLKQKLMETEDKVNSKDLDELIEKFLELEKIDKLYLYRLIEKIEIDKDKNVYLYFNFSKLNFICENMEGVIKIEKLLKEIV